MTDRRREHEAYLEAAGLVRIRELWVRPEDEDKARAYDARESVPRRKPGRKGKEKRDGPDS